MSLQEEDQNRW